MYFNTWRHTWKSSMAHLCVAAHRLRNTALGSCYRYIMDDETPLSVSILLQKFSAHTLLSVHSTDNWGTGLSHFFVVIKRPSVHWLRGPGNVPITRTPLCTDNNTLVYQSLLFLELVIEFKQHWLTICAQTCEWNWLLNRQWSRLRRSLHSKLFVTFPPTQRKEIVSDLTSEEYKLKQRNPNRQHVHKLRLLWFNVGTFTSKTFG